MHSLSFIYCTCDAFSCRFWLSIFILFPLPDLKKKEKCTAVHAKYRAVLITWEDAAATASTRRLENGVVHYPVNVLADLRVDAGLVSARALDAPGDHAGDVPASRGQDLDEEGAPGVSLPSEEAGCSHRKIGFMW